MDILLPGADILVLSPTPTAPQNFGNRKRVHSVCMALKERGVKIHFLYYPSESDWRNTIPLDALSKMQKQWVSFNIIPPSRDLHPQAEAEDHHVDEWWDDVIGHYLTWLFRVKRFDAFIVNYTWLSKALDYAPKQTLKILDTNDKFSGRRQLLEANGIEREFFHTTEHQEKIALERADLVWAIKDQERDFFQKLTKGPTIATLIHADFDQTTFTSQDRFKNGYLRIGLLGARNNINLLNTKQFLKVALATFREFLAPIKIVLAGSMCLDMEDLDYPNVEKLGVLEHVEAFYRNVDLVVVPVTFSTGLKIKVAEAIKYRMPLISHTHASEGFPMTHPYHKLDTLEQVARMCVEVSFEESRLSELRIASEEAGKNIESAFSNTIFKALVKVRNQNLVTVFVLSAQDLDKNNIRYIRLWELLSYVPHAGRSLVYIHGQVNVPMIEQLRKMSEQVHVFTNKTDPDVSSLVTQTESLDSLCRCWDADQLWLLTPLNEQAINAIENLSIELIVDQMSLSPEATFPFNGFKGKCVITSDQLTPPQSFKAHEQWIIPNFYPEKMTQLGFQFCPLTEGGKTLILYSGGRAHLAFYSALLAKIKFSNQQLIWLVNSGDEVDDLLALSETVLLKKDVENDTTTLPRKIHFVVNFDFEGEFSWLLEAFKRNALPILLMDHQKKATSNMWLHTFIRKYTDLYSDNNSRKLEISSEFQNDAGWTILWERMAKKSLFKQIARF